MKISVPRTAILAMQLLSSKDSTRRILYHAVNFEVTATRVILASTDGRKLAALNCGSVLTAPENKTSITLDIPTAMLKALPKNHGDNVYLELKDGQVSISHDKNAKDGFFITPIEGEFPKWRTVVPRDAVKAAMSPQFDYSLLAPIVLAAEMIGGRKPVAVSLLQNDELAPILVQFPSVPSLVCVLMPMSVYNTKDSELPEWVAAE